MIGARKAEKADSAPLVTRVLLGAGTGALPRLKRRHGALFSPWQLVALYPSYEQRSGGAVVSKQIVYRPPELL